MGGFQVTSSNSKIKVARCLNFYLYEVKEDLEIFFFEYLVALCLSFRKYSILNLRIVTLRDTILQTYLVEKHKLEPGLDSGIWSMDSGLCVYVK